nr:MULTISPECIES: PTS sugar transporter subunit IIB [Breznakia]
MKQIRLFCNAGMSTSMLVKKMEESAAQRGIEVEIKAYPLNDLSAKMEEAEILLLGPQVGYEEKRVRGLAEPKGIAVGVIPMVDYGMMNGAKVLDYALALK